MCAVLYIAFIFIYSVCSGLANENPEANTQKKCKLPPKSWLYDFYSTDKRVYVGYEAASMMVYITCIEGYGLSGPNGIFCSNGVWSHDPPFPECLPYCDMENDTKVVSCGMERCVPQPYPRPRPYEEYSSILFRNTDQDDCGSPRVATVFGSTGSIEVTLVMPWHAAIFTKTTTPFTQICGGSLVTKSIVVSAAHCFWSGDKQLPVDNYVVALGKRNVAWDGPREISQTSDVREVKIPPGFRGASNQYQDDIALVILKLPVLFTPNVQPVCLNFNHTLEKTQLVHESVGKVAGWGVTADDENISPWLKTTDIPFVEKEKCIQDSPPEFLPSITADKICVGYKNSTGLCAGDSGSGLVFLGGEAEKRFYLRGVMCSPRDPQGKSCRTDVWATSTLISSHERFIKENMPDIFN